jgi:hypothetical protein
LHFIKISLNIDQPLLNGFLRNKLNPLLINVLACKDVPFKTEPKFKPIYAVFKFVDGKYFKTI